MGRMMSKEIHGARLQPDEPLHSDSLAMALLDAWNKRLQKADEEASVNAKTDEFDLLVAEEVAKLKRLNLTHDDLLQCAAESAVLADVSEEAYFFTKDRLAECELAFRENGLTLAKEVKALDERLKNEKHALRLVYMNEVRLAMTDGVSLQKKAHGRNTADARHSKPGGSREKRLQMRGLWASGQYNSRDICAEQECAAVGMSFSTARRALRGTPDPT